MLFKTLPLTSPKNDFLSHHSRNKIMLSSKGMQTETGRLVKHMSSRQLYNQLQNIRI